MSKEKRGKRGEILLSSRFGDDTSGLPEIPFRRWLVGELASHHEPGTLFNIKFKNLKLNSKEEQERLIELERVKGRKKSND